MEDTEPAICEERYEVRSEDGREFVEVIDRKPWLRCWSCSHRNATPTSFCEECGAVLEPRRYLGQITSGGDGLDLVATIEDRQARQILPQIWDVVDYQGRKLVVFGQDEVIPVTIPLDAASALRVGLELARLLVVLHEHNLELGALAPTDLGFTKAGQLRLARVEALHRISHEERDEAIRSDVQALAGLLEALTKIPRETQRLDANPTSSAQTVSPEPDLPLILRDIRTGVLSKATDLLARLEEAFAPKRPVMLRQLVGSATSTGKVREHNEDSLLAMMLTTNNTSVERTWGVFMVADGMGGHAGGEVASGIAIRRAAEVLVGAYFSTALNHETPSLEEKARELVRRAVVEANKAVRHEASERGNDMGTTLTMALVIGDRAIIANVGDSRTYLYRHGKLVPISRDHSLVMRLVEHGYIHYSDIYTHPQRNAVLRSLGDRPSLEIDVFTQQLQPGDALLLCSDGQWEMTHDPEMEAILAAHSDPAQACQELIAAANRAGGEDNITSILVRFV